MVLSELSYINGSDYAEYFGNHVCEQIKTNSFFLNAIKRFPTSFPFAKIDTNTVIEALNRLCDKVKQYLRFNTEMTQPSTPNVDYNVYSFNSYLFN
jgi:hypothetical protein